jgi:hypothetical protein
MTCKEIEKQIPLFLSDSLEEEELEEFISHVKQCRNCEEELAIQYLTVVGLERLEEGASFSLDDELVNKINRAERRIVIERRIEKVCRAIELAAILVLGTAIVYMAW